MRSRLFVQIYTAFLAISLLTLVAAGLAVRWAVYDTVALPASVRAVAGALVQTLPDPRQAPLAYKRALAAQADRLGLHVSVWSEDGVLLGQVGEGFAAPPAGCPEPFVRSRAGKAGVCVQLPDGQWVAVARLDARVEALVARATLALFMVFFTIAVGCWPLARRITSRLERLEHSVSAFGQGALGARVDVVGTDEVARVAATFNEAADRVEALVDQQRQALAHASHELRSPLARLRMALALIEDAGSDVERACHLDTAIAEVAELDALIEDVLLASRLRGGVVVPRALAPIDLAPVVTKLAATAGAVVVWKAEEDHSVSVLADERLLRRALSNLVANAVRHGAPPVELHIWRSAEWVHVAVCDRGPGVDPALSDTVFAPFVSRGGVGLGLALVDEIVCQHGGQVEHRQRQGGGAVFETRWPLDGGD